VSVVSRLVQPGSAQTVTRCFRQTFQERFAYEDTAIMEDTLRSYSPIVVSPTKFYVLAMDAAAQSRMATRTTSSSRRSVLAVRIALERIWHRDGFMMALSNVITAAIVYST
jgi:hypothetical protein